VGAILMRQTNVIWLGWILIDTAWTALVGKKNKKIPALTVSPYNEEFELGIDRYRYIGT